MVYNENIKEFVMWFRVVPFTASGQAMNWTGETYLVANSKTPTGRFQVTTAHPFVNYGTGGDFAIFIDDDAEHTAYISYTSHNTNTSIVLERLNANYSSSVPGAVYGPFRFAPVEAPAMFKYAGWYYVAFGHTCCYCLDGSNLYVFASQSALGPYQYLGDIGLQANGSCCVTQSQQNYIATVGSTLLWTGTRWGSSPDGTMRHDFQYWLPLSFESKPFADRSPSPPMPHNLTWQDQFELDLLQEQD